MAAPRIVVVGLGPAGPDLLAPAALDAMAAAPVRFLRTGRHPAAAAVTATATAATATFDHVYETSGTLDEVYATIVALLLDAAHEHGHVAYAVPGSPLVAERTVERLRARAPESGVEVRLVPALSFLDLAWVALGVDPLAAGVRLVDGHRFAAEAAGERGPLLVAQCDTRDVLSDVKLAVDDWPDDATVTLLHHLGLPDEVVTTVPWSEMDRTLAPDHLTTLWVPHLGAPVGAELVRFHGLVRTLREQCPWDIDQTHHTLTRHLLEETHEVLEAIEALPGGANPAADPVAADEHLCEELGDLLFQIEFHATIAEQEGRFTMADVARTVHDKLVRRHPHVFGSVAVSGTDEVLTNWEAIKRTEKAEAAARAAARGAAVDAAPDAAASRASVLDGVPGNLPALLTAHKVQKKAASVGFDWPDVQGAFPKIAEELVELRLAIEAGLDAPEVRAELGDLLFAVVNVARHLDIDPETALLAATAKFRRRFQGVEALAEAEGVDLARADLATLDALWDRVKGRETPR